jgi:hypothetical protein
MPRRVRHMRRAGNNGDLLAMEEEPAMSARGVIAGAIWRYEREICGGPDEDYARWRAADPETDAIYMTHAGSVMHALRDAGYAVVPREPTLAMVGAARDEADCIGDIYRAMIAASEKEPGQ